MEQITQLYICFVFSTDVSPPQNKKAKAENGKSSVHVAKVELNQAVVIGKLPGLGEYVQSSDETSDSRSEDSDVDTDIFAKQIQLQFHN